MGARFDDLTFVLWRGDMEEGATPNPKIYNMENMTIAYIKVLVTS